MFYWPVAKGTSISDTDVENFDADIFVVEEDIFEKPFKQQFKDEAD